MMKQSPSGVSVPSGSVANHSQPHSRDFLCGWGAASIETCVLFPIHKLTFRQQLHGIKIRTAAKQISNEGFVVLYRGLLPPLIQKTSCRALMFGMYEEYQRFFGCVDPRKRFTLWHAISAFLAGSTEALLTPLERIQVLLQTSRYQSNFRNTLSAFSFLRTYGLSEYYRGFSMIVSRNGFSNVVFFGLRDPVRRLISPDQDNSQLREIAATFSSGALLGAFNSTLFFPVNVIKTRMQSHLGGPFDSWSTILRLIWTERKGSFFKFARGWEINMTRSILTWGLTNAIYEVLERFLRRNEYI